MTRSGRVVLVGPLPPDVLTGQRLRETRLPEGVTAVGRDLNPAHAPGPRVSVAADLNLPVRFVYGRDLRDGLDGAGALPALSFPITAPGIHSTRNDSTGPTTSAGVNPTAAYEPSTAAVPASAD